jgi:beta-phosphoglucomutase-like phosphatase (HAD superfamily)
MPEKKNLIVFDIDGTLADSVAIHQAGFVHALKYLGVAAIDENFHNYQHHTDLHIARSIYESAFQKQFDSATRNQFEDRLYHNIAASGAIQEIKGAKQFVAHIETETTFGVCYATGSMQRPAAFKLEKIGIGFDPLQLSASNHTEERAAIVQTAIRNACAYYGTTQFDRIIAFGDGIWDLKTAQQLAIGFVGIGDKNKMLMEAAGMKIHKSDYMTFDLAFFN